MAESEVIELMGKPDFAGEKEKQWGEKRWFQTGRSGTWRDLPPEIRGTTELTRQLHWKAPSMTVIVYFRHGRVFAADIQSKRKT